jgi:EAL domain-containing protein (putative c-di-GMP-specific phosphodiesterase class I)
VVPATLTLEITESGVMTDPDAAIVRSTIELASNLGPQLVAEGVENPGDPRAARLSRLRRRPGLPPGPPMPADDLARLAAGEARTRPAAGLS